MAQRVAGVHPFLDYDVEIRRIVCRTNAIESLNARHRRAVRASGHFLAEQAALKCLYLVTRSLDPTGTAPLGLRSFNPTAGVLVVDDQILNLFQLDIEMLKLRVSGGQR